MFRLDWTCQNYGKRNLFEIVPMVVAIEMMLNVEKSQYEY
jgi:hypothetical protein